MLPAGGRQHYTTSCNTQSSAPEEGQNKCPKHVELTGIINKPLLLHLVGCLYYLYQCCMVKQISNNEIYLLIKYIKSVLWRVVKRLSYIQDARCLKVNSSGIWCHTVWAMHFVPMCWRNLLSLSSIFALKVEVAGSFEILIPTLETTWNNIPKELYLVMYHWLWHSD